MAYALLAYTLRGNPVHWCPTLPEKSIHSLSHMVVEIDHAFNCFNRKVLDKEILKLRKSPNESVEQFHMRFCNLAYLLLEDEIDWEFSMEYLSIFFTHLKI